MKKLFFIFTLSIIVPLSSIAQLDSSLQLSGKTIGELNATVPEYQIFHFNSLRTFSFNVLPNSVFVQKESAILCEKYSGKSATAFFCRMEDKLERKVKFPVRMRLGTLNYVDQLEQKNSAVPNY